MDLQARLCYIDGNKAYFTTNFEKQWGDDWDDAPYEHNAGTPYEYYDGCTKPKWEVYRCFWDGPFRTPADIAGCNSSYSVQKINRRDIAWLSPDWNAKEGTLPILAGVTFEEFCTLMEAAGGEVFIPRKSALTI